MGGGTARLLVALKRPSGASAPLLLAGGDNFRAAFRRGAIPTKPPLLVDPVSVRDPGLAPAGGATLTVTMGAVPARLFDGVWTQERRLRLAASALGRIEMALPGTLAAVSGIRMITPADIEDRLGVSNGDLDGGQLAPDQMLALRPGPRTALGGFYPRRRFDGGGTASVPGRRALRRHRLAGGSRMKKYDAIIIGANVGGLAAAAYLARAGKRVLVLEREMAPPEPIGLVYALDPVLLSELGLSARGLRFVSRDLAAKSNRAFARP